MTLRLLQEARDETKEAYDWYDDNRFGLGEEFLHELEIVYERIEEHPRRSRKIEIPELEHREFRQQMLRRFPYKVIFEIQESAIVVLAVMHARRRPYYWADRT